MAKSQKAQPTETTPYTLVSVGRHLTQLVRDGPGGRRVLVFASLAEARAAAYLLSGRCPPILLPDLEVNTATWPSGRHSLRTHDLAECALYEVPPRAHIPYSRVFVEPQSKGITRQVLTIEAAVAVVMAQSVVIQTQARRWGASEEEAYDLLFTTGNRRVNISAR